MEEKPGVVRPRNIIARGFAEFIHDLLAGDLVALGICAGLILFFAAIAVAGVWFIWNRKKAKEAFAKKVAEKRRKEDLQYKASKKTKDI